MKLPTLLFLAAAVVVGAAHVDDEPKEGPSKRQTYEATRFLIRTPRKQVAPVEEPLDEDKDGINSRADEEYRPGQVFSLNSQELLALQPERKAPSSSQQLQHLYPEQPEHRQNIQQIFFIEPQLRRQVTLQPSHAVITRPLSSSNGGEASVGAALSVSDTGHTSHAFDDDLLALLRHPSIRKEDAQIYANAATQKASAQNIAAQYQQIDKYAAKPNKKPSKLRPKYQSQAEAAPQQYLIETTSVQQPQYQHQQLQQYKTQTRPQQALRYVIQPTPQQGYYEQPGSEAVKIIPAPKLQPRPAQLSYSVQPQYPTDTPKQFRLLDSARQPFHYEQNRGSSVERPVVYAKRYQDLEKPRSIKIYDQGAQGAYSLQHPPSQIVAEPIYLRQVYRNDPRAQYDIAPIAIGSIDQPRVIDPTKPPHSAIYVNKNVAAKKTKDQAGLRQQTYRLEQVPRYDQVNIEQHGKSLEEQRARLPPPKNNKAYTPEEFAALLAAGYAVTPIPVSSVDHQAQSRSAVDSPAQEKRLFHSRFNQYLPFRADEAP